MKTKASLQKRSHNSNTVTQRSHTPLFNKSSDTSETAFFSSIQTKLTLGKSGDKFEQQADHMADKVVSGQKPANNSLYHGISSIAQKQSEPEEMPEVLEAEKQESDSAPEAVQAKKHENELEAKPNEIAEQELQAKASEKQEEQLSRKSEETAEQEQQTKTTEKQEDQISKKPQETAEKELQPKATEKQEEQLNKKPEQGKNKEELQTKAEEQPLQAKSTTEQAHQLNDNEQDEEQVRASPLQALSSESRQVANPVETQLRAEKGKGNPLAENIRMKMEGSFSADFSGVKIHNNDIAVKLTEALNAQAITHGSDIFFNKNKFSPQTKQGEHLLAHELTHTIQQGAVAAKDIQAQKEPEEIQAKEDDDSYLTRPEVLKAISLARSQMGKVNSKKISADKTREGWDRLYEYFFTAFGEKETIHKDVIKFNNADLPSWCGIFVWWALKKANIPIADWKLGVSIMGELKQRGLSELPRKGDIAYDQVSNQHFAMVSGLESYTERAGKSHKSIKVATINGNTAGEDNLGGQIQEKWHNIGRWTGFFDPVAKLNMPDVPLVRTSAEQDITEGAITDQVPEEAPVQVETPEQAEEVIAEGLQADAELAPEDAVGDEADIEVELPEAPAEVAIEKGAEVAKLDFAGSSDQAIVGFTEAAPSQMAKSFPALGTAVSSKLDKEKQDEAADAPDLELTTSGSVTEGIISPDQIPIPGVDTSETLTEQDPAKLEVSPTENKSQTPSNKANDKLMDKQSEGGFIEWLKNNISNLMRQIQTTDPGLNTSAGERQKVSLEGQANPQRSNTERDKAQNQVKQQRDDITDSLKTNPGQTNIQPRKLEIKQAVVLSKEKTEPVITQEDKGMADYATAPLPEAVRTKADSMLQPGITANVAEAKNKTQQAAEKKETDKKSTIEIAKAEAAKQSKAAENEQKNVVIDNRTKVSAQQKQGIENAYSETNTFNTESGKEQKETQTTIGDKVVDSEEKAKTKLEDGEKDAETKKKEGEKEAAEKKKELEKEQNKGSWWDRAANFVKKAVKAITSAIDAVFNAVRSAVKALIDIAKKAAVGLINAARDWAVDKLNKFRDWSQAQVNKYLGDKFPGIAKAINGAIDSVVDVAIQGVNIVADAAIAGVEALAKGLTAALDKILSVMQTAMKAAVQIAGAVLTGDFAGALKIAIQAACDIAGIDSKPIFDFFDRAGQQIMKILKEPGVFFNNLMKAVGGGVRGFAKNIRQHLVSGLIGWLTGALSEVEITLPEKFDVKGIFDLVMQILGLTTANIKARVIKRYPPAEKIFDVIEKGIAIILKIKNEGPVALWEEAKKSLGNLKKMVLSGIRSFVITTVVKEAITWLLGLLNPAGALIKILKLLFDFVMFLVQRFQQIKDFVLSAYNSIAAIASGQLGNAMKAVEGALAKSLPVVISLLASLAGLGGIGKTVKNIIKKISAPVNKVLDKVIDRVVTFAKKWYKKGKGVAKAVKDKIVSWWKVEKKFKADNGEDHRLFFKGTGKNAVLSMSSSHPVSYTNFIQSVKDTLKPGDQSKLNDALVKAKEIDAIKAEPINKNQSKDKIKKAEKDKQKLLEDKLAKLTEPTKGLFGEKLPTWDGKERLNFGGSNGGFGGWMDVKELTKEGGGIGKGSIPSSTLTNENWTHLDKRRGKDGQRIYVKGHLLNHNIGGTGKEWKNLTPLSYSGNSKHLSKVETLVKTAVTAGVVVNYKVETKGHGTQSSASIMTAIKKDRPAEADDIQKILKAEEFVPATLLCNASRLQESDNTWIPIVSDKEVPNPINHKEPDEYNLDTKVKIKPVKISSMGGEADLKVQKHDKLTTELVSCIWKAEKVRRDAVKESDRFHSYALLAAAIKEQNPGKDTLGDLTELHNGNYIIL